MKAVIVQAEGLASHPREELDGRTPLQVASTPNLDSLASEGEYGLLTLPPGGYNLTGEITHLALLGYDPRKYYPGPGPFEGAGLEVTLEQHDVAFLCHLVTLRSDDRRKEDTKLGPHLILDDDQAGGIDSAEARELIAAVNDELASETIQFYVGEGFRHLMVWAGGTSRWGCGNPHQAVGRSVDSFLPTGEGANTLLEIMEASRMILRNHPVNRERQEEGIKPANCLWLWGPGRAVELPKFTNRWALTGATVSVASVHRGIGICAGLEGVNPDQDHQHHGCDFGCYLKACGELLQTKDCVYLHIPNPSHRDPLDARECVRVIEAFDGQVVGALKNALPKLGKARLLVVCNQEEQESRAPHVSLTPYVLYGTATVTPSTVRVPFNELEAQHGSVREATKLIDRLLGHE